MILPLRAAMLIPLFALPAFASPAETQSNPVASARGVLRRLIGNRADTVRLDILPSNDGRDVLEYEAADGKLVVRGSSGVALSRGFYEYLKAEHLGMVGWAGKRLNLPKLWPDAPRTRIETPFRYRYYFNVVTYGYTMPYWDWQRWEQELDWMALHGVNFPLAMVGTEAIGSRVWQKIGLTQAEIDEFFTGPAHLPWHRMGNLTKHDGPLSERWLKDQTALQHRILKRMKELGITPIVQGFGGFVPRGIQRLYPDLKLQPLQWGGGFPDDKQPRLMDHKHPLFQRLGKMFVEEYEKEFGKQTFYLADTFNEMSIPGEGEERIAWMADFGKTVYESIRAGNPDAVWVIQGWMFGYDASWTPELTRALLSKVPDDKMMILDEACDYNAIFWRTPFHYKKFDGFYGKRWVYGTIPNMGGKTGYTGVLDFYAKGIFDALAFEGKGNLEGYGTAPEGIENNEAIYELVTDVAWRDKAPDTRQWLKEYSLNRYGAFPDELERAWSLLLDSCYGTFTDHPQFGWQQGRRWYGSMTRDPKFFDGVRSFLACRNELGGNELYRADAIEQAAMVLGAKASEWFLTAYNANDFADHALRDRASARGLELLDQADRLLESHPMHRLERWIRFARKSGRTEAEKDLYEANARRIVTVWGPPINDYSCRLWSGLIRDYYRPRMERVFREMATGSESVWLDGVSKDGLPDGLAPSGQWHENFVRTVGLSKPRPYSTPLAAAAQLVEAACTEAIPSSEVPEARIVARWTADMVEKDWKTVEWKVPAEKLNGVGSLRFVYTHGGHRLEIDEAAWVFGDKVVALDKHYAWAGIPNRDNDFDLAIPEGVDVEKGLTLRAVIRGSEGQSSNGMVVSLPRRKARP